MEELVLWGPERDSSGMGTASAKALRSEGRSLTATAAQGPWILLSALGSRGEMGSDDL